MQTSRDTCGREDSSSSVGANEYQTAPGLQSAMRGCNNARHFILVTRQIIGRVQDDKRGSSV